MTKRIVKWRIPDATGATFQEDCNLTEVGVSGDSGGIVSRIVFDKPLTVLAGEWLEISPEGEVFIASEVNRVMAGALPTIVSVPTR